MKSFEIKMSRACIALFYSAIFEIMHFEKYGEDSNIKKIFPQ